MSAGYDFLACRGDCYGFSSVEFLGALYSSASNIDLYLQPGTGHGLTLHKGARQGYQVTFDWLDGQGL